MATINKVEAFIKAAEIMTSGENEKEALIINRIIVKSIENDRKTNSYTHYIKLTREEKKLFAISPE